MSDTNIMNLMLKAIERIPPLGECDVSCCGGEVFDDVCMRCGNPSFPVPGVDGCARLVTSLKPDSTWEPPDA